MLNKPNSRDIKFEDITPEIEQKCFTALVDLLEREHVFKATKIADYVFRGHVPDKHNPVKKKNWPKVVEKLNGLIELHNSEADDFEIVKDLPQMVCFRVQKGNRLEISLGIISFYVDFKESRQIIDELEETADVTRFNPIELRQVAGIYTKLDIIR